MPDDFANLLQYYLEHAEELLHHYQEMVNFIGLRLPFTLEDDPFDPVRYYFGDDDWVDLLITYFPDYGFDVQIVDCSSDQWTISDVYLELMERERTKLLFQTPQLYLNKPPDSVIQTILARLEQVEQKPLSPEARQGIPSPYLNAPEAASYLRITLNALYGLVERRKLKPLPGHRKYRFTKDILDAYLKGE